MSTELTIDEKVAVAEMLGFNLRLIDVATNAEPLHIKTERFNRIVSIARKCGIDVVPTLGRVDLVVPGYTPPPSVKARDIQVGERFVRYGEVVTVETVRVTSGGIAKINNRSFYVDDNLVLVDEPATVPS